MQEAKHRIQDRLKVIDSILRREPPAAEGYLVYRKRKGKARFCLRTKDGKEHYLGQARRGEICLLAQKKYELMLRAAAEMERRRLKAALELLEKVKPCENAYGELSPMLKPFVEPYNGTDEAYARKWQETRFGQKKMDSDKISKTLRGDKVRSKSEAIIADRLYLAGIPYHYEAPFEVRGHGFCYPDFMVLNKRTRQVFRWEHFGMLDDPKYCMASFRKLCLYAENNLILGRNLLVSFETGDQPLDTDYIDLLIERNLK